MVKFIVSGILVAIFAFIINLSLYLGVFRPVSIEISNEPEMLLLVQSHLGAYHKIVSKIEEVETWAKSNNLDCHLSLGEYLDNPDIIEEARLKSFAGCLITATAAAKLPTLPQGFVLQKISPQKYVKALFNGSPSIGPIKVYPKAIKFAEENRLKLKQPIFEIYELKGTDKDVNKMTTTYLFSVEGN